MERQLLLLLCCGLLCCTGCAAGKPAAQAIIEQKELAVPVGKNWQVKEEPPNLTDERGHLPFQTEQSMKPEGTKGITPAERQRLETQQ